MLIGGSERTNNDIAMLRRSEGKSRYWSCPKEAQVGDRVMIYVAAPISSIVATAEVKSLPVSGSERGRIWRYMAKIGPIRLLASPIPFDEMRRLCPRWKWLNYPRAYAYVPPKEAKALLKRASQRTTPTAEVVASANGAGFGSPEQNRKVEKAAVKEVTNFYKQRGHTVRSREKDNLGYDLDVSKGSRVLHVEVKGASGTIPAFPITCGEVARAKSDNEFVLAVVTNALKPRLRKLKRYSAEEFLRRHALTPIAFMAKPKK